MKEVVWDVAGKGGMLWEEGRCGSKEHGQALEGGRVGRERRLMRERAAMSVRLQAELWF